MIGYDAELVAWGLPRLMCGVLRDGVMNVPELVEYLNLTDTPFMMDAKHWPRFRDIHAEVLETFDTAQKSAILDWLEVVRSMVRKESLLGPAVERILDLEIVDWRRRVSDTSHS